MQNDLQDRFARVLAELSAILIQILKCLTPAPLMGVAPKNPQRPAAARLKRICMRCGSLKRSHAEWRFGDRRAA